MKVLALNAGSNSLKFQIVDLDGRSRLDSPEFHFGRTLVRGAYDNIGKNGGVFTLFDGERETHREEIALADYGDAATQCFDWIDSGAGSNQGVQKTSDLERIGHRVVHGADLFHGPAKIDPTVIDQIEGLADLAPLHNEAALSVIRVAQKRVDGERMVAVFDTAFHRTIPEEAALYGLPLQVSKELKIRRYGFHGISHRYMTIRYGQITGRPLQETRLITLHLEGGSSVAAIRGGLSVDTSMGLTPLEGLIMGTRSGDLDPAIVPYLMRKRGLDVEGVEKFLNKECGLLGISGISGDTRELMQRLDEDSARLALDIFSYRVRKYVGSYLAVLGGADAIVFGGGIGENTPYVRARVCEGLSALGIELDSQRNQEVIDREGLISTDDSRPAIWVIPTEEALMVAHETASIDI
jgi:acetate kinase